MQVRMTQQEPPVYRVQRDGPSPAEQAQDALIQELSAHVGRLSAEISSIAVKGRSLDAGDRARLRELRDELATTAAQLRSVEQDRRERALESVVQDAILPRGAGGRTGTAVFRDGPRIPPEAVDISIAFFICVAAAIVLFPLMRSLGRILERRAAPPQRLGADAASQLTRMEQALDAVAIEVERIAESQRYSAKLLAERDKSAV